MCSRRTLPLSRFLVLLLATLYGCGGTDDPETFITNAPADTLDGSLNLQVHWAGMDRDGSIKRYEYRLLENSQITPWISTTDTHRDFRIDLEDTGWRFTVRAVDDDDNVDPTPSWIAPLLGERGP